jgi:hypothetical protein
MVRGKGREFYISILSGLRKIRVEKKVRFWVHYGYFLHLLWLVDSENEEKMLLNKVLRCLEKIMTGKREEAEIDRLVESSLGGMDG